MVSAQELPAGLALGEGAGPAGDPIGDAALRLYDAVGFDSVTAVRLAEAGYDLIGYAPVVDEVTL